MEYELSRSMAFNKFNIFLFSALFFWLGSCTPERERSSGALQIGVIADVHLQDVYGNLRDNGYKGVKNPVNGKNTLIRTMGSQLHSTRIFNENYFAFLAALDDVAKRNVKYVLLPGDFSDNGQPLNIRGLKGILEMYSQKYGISFFLIPGNHDVVFPFNHPDGKTDFLGEGGKPQPIVTNSANYPPNRFHGHQPVISNDLQNLGYEGVSNILNAYGFFPTEEDLYWESPFSKYAYDTYNFEAAKQQSSLKNRSQLIPPNDIPLPDLSYLVEPVDGLWLLALDANTYIKEAKTSGNLPSQNYHNTGKGQSNLLDHKKYLLDWVRNVVLNAAKRGKTLITFSHYPMVDFTDGASRQISDLLIGSQMQLNRVPDEEIARTFADAGLKLHFGGHMHMNDTGIRTTDRGNTLVNVQVPSLAAYKPAYKLITIQERALVEVQTVIIDSVPRFNEFFGLYKEEYEYLERIGEKNIWDRDILTSKSYQEFITWHLKELVRLRYLPDEWPAEISDFILHLSGRELLLLAHSSPNVDLEKALREIRNDSSFSTRLTEIARDSLKTTNLSLDEFSGWTGGDLIFDLYRLRSADQLAFSDIGKERMAQYMHIIETFSIQRNEGQTHDKRRKNIFGVIDLMRRFMSGEPSDHFRINLINGEVIPIK